MHQAHALDEGIDQGKWSQSLAVQAEAGVLQSLGLLTAHVVVIINDNLFTVKPLRIERIVLVTHGFHMQRALANFERAQQASQHRITIVPAPMGLRADGPTTLGDWLPSLEGFALTYLALHEWLGRMMGA